MSVGAKRNLQFLSLGKIHTDWFWSLLGPALGQSKSYRNKGNIINILLDSYGGEGGIRNRPVQGL